MIPEGKVALITGGAMGMGKGFADSLLQAGAKVCVADYNVEVGEEAVKELNTKYGAGKAIFVKCDVTSQADMEAAFETTKKTFGGIDIVVNNAGVGGEADDNWERCIDINMKGTMRGIRLAMNYLSKENGGNGGTIINMASLAGVNPNPFSPTYGCTKAGIIHASRCLAISPVAAKSSIRINVMCPAFVDTPMFRNMKSGDPSQTYHGDPTLVQAFIDRVGVITIEEAAEAFMELVKDDTKNGVILKLSKTEGKKYCTLAVQNLD